MPDSPGKYRERRNPRRSGEPSGGRTPPTEDHPLDYAGFEGVIPAGEYGAGPVIVWDRGTYDHETEGSSGEPIDLDEAIERGHVRVRLHGKKLRGGYALTRLGGGGRRRWLLVKTAGESARGGHGQEAEPGPGSVKSGQTIEQMATGRRRPA
jgi:ATP-dependent DNA ligase